MDMSTSINRSSRPPRFRPTPIQSILSDTSKCTSSSEPLTVSIGGKYIALEDKYKNEGPSDRWAVGLLPESQMTNDHPVYSATIKTIAGDESELETPVSVISALSRIMQAQFNHKCCYIMPSISFVQGDKLIKIGYPYSPADGVAQSSIALIGATITRMQHSGQTIAEIRDRFDAPQFERIWRKYPGAQEGFDGSNSKQISSLQDALRSDDADPQNTPALKDCLDAWSLATVSYDRKSRDGKHDEYSIEYLPSNTGAFIDDWKLNRFDRRKTTEDTETRLMRATKTATSLLATLLHNECTDAKIDLYTEEEFGVRVIQSSNPESCRISLTDYNSSRQ
ncbi:hypothetical protein I204_05399 [Kwoniella mangroviensis CBS 8886]|nr:hypothetical protein I204_05399 [Kwoniella mangroviensis CBS 8886]